MRQAVIGTLILALIVLSSCGNETKGQTMIQLNKLTVEEARVIIHKGTERPYTGIYTDHFDSGTYLCRHCSAPLYRSENKFHSGCGWPAFDDALPGAVKRIPDPDGVRTEIVCAHCEGHLGHVFEGEQFTAKNVRHCVNSISLTFVPDSTYAKAWFGGGCFWGVEHYLAAVPGVISAVSGYMGGSVPNPTYEQVCHGTTGHAEVVEVTYDPALVSYESLTRAFFTIHDPTQLNRQGPDVGTQYRSIIFVQNDTERITVNNLIDQLKRNGYDVVTEVVNRVPFYRAEGYHQEYYRRKGTEPYCHFPVDRFK